MTALSRVHFQIALAFWLGALLCSSALAQATAPAPVRPAVLKPLQAAQEALKNNQAQQAIALAKEALAVSQLSAAELVAVQRTLVVAAINAQDHQLASESLQVLLSQPDLTPSDQRIFLESLIQARLQLKDAAGVVKWSRQYLEQGGNKTVMRLVLLQSLSELNANEEVVSQMQSWFKQVPAGTGPISEAELRTLAVSYRKLKDQAGYEATLWRLLESYPSKAYWAESIARQAQKSNVNPRLELDLYRMLEETGNLEEVEEFIEMVQLALKAGLPAEAQRILDLGYQKTLLGQGDQAAAHEKLRQQVRAKVLEDAKLLETLERGAQDGNSWAALGDAHLSQQQWSLAHTAYAKALAAGGLRRETEVQLHLAIALFKSGEPEQCRKILLSIKEDATAAALAHLWRIRSLHP